MATKLLVGKVAVVMGAANKIGKAVAEKFAANGAKVILADPNHNACYAIASGINHIIKPLSAAQAMLAPATDPSKILDALEEAKIIRTQQEVDIFYHDPAFYSTDSIDITNLQLAMKANVESVLRSIEHVGGVMSKKSGGCILCTGSTLGLLGDVVPSAYSISMAALVGVIRAKAVELAVGGVRVHAISPHLAPPIFGTDLLKRIYPNVQPEQLDDLIHKYVNNRRPEVTVDDVADAAVYLASGACKDAIGPNIELKDRFPLNP